MLTDRVLLISGGTGSFGTAVLKRFIKSKIGEIRIFSRDEKKQDDLRKKINNTKVKFFIGDVRDKNSVDNVMRGVDYVFHAAALKQVPSCEFFPMQAVKTNVMGAENILHAALKFGIKKVIVLSTDKAVYPINAMGLSKALMEKVMVAMSRNSDITVMCGTRYGNVMASRGSVIPLFIQQIKEGMPLTITDPDMTRFMMTLDDAVNLVLYAFENGMPGDMFVQKSPASTINTLAHALKSLYHADNPIKYIGTRHGEKIFETLVSREEMVKATDMGEYYRISADNRDLNYDLYFSEGKKNMSKIEEYHSHNTKRLNLEDTKKILLKLDIIRDDIAKIQNDTCPDLVKKSYS
ncbi:polysaccharide biosynthesis protein [Desulfobacula toluolica]|uniref:UDP-glucose 4-epimerase n=1 Tax=Desulfobacula toluolica (strain DSM 7467 / Tol2) TaxID=651182 RepID=K0NDL7_DESTT|nr:polysaccharide biosynthesis protein [Desulfobacula toluolica]CCK78981.1 CapD: UDP-glucose 4-epimerase [Desulfobacula toluolica Tol2]